MVATVQGRREREQRRGNFRGDGDDGNDLAKGMPMLTLVDKDIENYHNSDDYNDGSDSYRGLYGAAGSGIVVNSREDGDVVVPAPPASDDGVGEDAHKLPPSPDGPSTKQRRQSNGRIWPTTGSWQMPRR